jgi:hypothetical protein
MNIKNPLSKCIVEKQITFGEAMYVLSDVDMPSKRLSGALEKLNRVLKQKGISRDVDDHVETHAHENLKSFAQEQQQESKKTSIKNAPFTSHTTRAESESKELANIR